MNYNFMNEMVDSKVIFLPVFKLELKTYRNKIECINTKYTCDSSSDVFMDGNRSIRYLLDIVDYDEHGERVIYVYCTKNTYSKALELIMNRYKEFLNKQIETCTKKISISKNRIGMLDNLGIDDEGKLFDIRHND